MGHCRCCPPHAASAPGLNPGSKATILAQPASQLLFSSGCRVWCEQTVSEWGDFLQWSPVKTQTCCQARPCFGGFGSAWAGMVSPLWSSQPQDAASAECWCLPLPAQHSQPPPAAREQPGREIFFHFFFYLFLFFSGTLYSTSIAGIPGGLLLSREDALFSARSCSGEGLEEIHSATFLLGLLARALQSAAATGQAGPSEIKRTEEVRAWL